MVSVWALIAEVNFYPRPPRGGRRVSDGVGGLNMTFLSTPSARRATAVTIACSRSTSYFYPRPPRGGRQDLLARDGMTKAFLSTPSARRATNQRQMV